jgi:hypothetical protein
LERRRDHHGNPDGELRFPRGHRRDGMLVRASRDDVPLWTGFFALGTGSIDALWFFPGSSIAIVVAAGAIYRLDVLHTDDVDVPGDDGCAMVVSDASRVAVVGDSGSGLVIVRERAAAERHWFDDADGFTELGVDGATIVGTYDAYGGDVETGAFAIDLAASTTLPSFVSPDTNAAPT